MCYFIYIYNYILVFGRREAGGQFINNVINIILFRDIFWSFNGVQYSILITVFVCLTRNNIIIMTYPLV